MNKKIKNTIKVASALVGIITIFSISYVFSNNIIIPNEEGKIVSEKSNYNEFYSENDFLNMGFVNYRYIYSIVCYYVITNNPEFTGEPLREKIYYHIKNSELYMLDYTVKENIDAWANQDFSNIANFFNYLNEKVGYQDTIHLLKVDNARIDYIKDALQLSE